jgi:hypothetical protein
MKSFTPSANNGSEELSEKWNTQENIEAFNVVAESTKHSSDKIKDPNNYVKKMTGYDYFYSVNRERVLDDPKIKAPDVRRELIRLWKGLTKDQQDEWSALSAELNRYWKDQ